ncbi:MAG: bifunctional DNA primase/polymerase [Leptolyngbyaceae cyanobacterium bins.302]|nr:bifunctional DNA primase/polymerase [Leptolyngbyaceae cyanobacterium bins.302]
MSRYGKRDRQNDNDRSSSKFRSSPNFSPNLPFLPSEWKFCRVVRGAKKPIDKQWQNKSLTVEQIRVWVEHHNENYGVIWGGTALGIDIDGESAHNKLHEVAAGQLIPPTVAWTSGTPDRYHLAFRLTPEQATLLTETAQKANPKSLQGRWFVKCNGANGKTEQLEFRWRKHQSILPPSLHPSGRRYSWLPGQSPAEQDVAIMTDWLFAYLLELVAPKKVDRPPSPSLSTSIKFNSQTPLEQLLRREDRVWIAEGVPEGCRNSSGAALARNLIGTADYLNQQSILFDGNPKTLFELFCDRCQPPIDESEREQIWNSAERSKPQPTLTPDAIANCAAAWEEKSRNYTPTPQKVEKSMPTRENQPSAIELLLEIAEDQIFFHTPSKIAFVDVWWNNCRQTMGIRSRPFKHLLAYQLYSRYERAASSETLNTVLNLLEAKANFEGEERQVDIRLAELDSKIYLDLGTDNWDAVEIDAEGWRIRSNYPVRFQRCPNLLSLPIPAEHNSLDDLWRILNVVPEDRVLVACWLLFCFYPKYSHPLLFFLGEQGVGKTMAAEILICLIDPCKAPLLPSVSDLRNLSITANHRWILAYDNLSGLTPEQSDALCRISTGGGFTVRTLYENDQETTFEFQRPQIITGIDCPASRGDLLSRAIQVRLHAIPEELRKTEAEIETTLSRVQDRILGALLTALSKTLKALPSVTCSPTRLADFARFAIAAEEPLGFPKGSFLAAYQGNQQESHQIAIEASPVAMAIQKFMVARQSWEGTASELLEELEKLVDEKVLRYKAWAGDSRRLGKALVRLAPDLRKGEGIEIEQGHNSRKTHRIVRLRKVVNSLSATSAMSVDQQVQGYVNAAPTGTTDNADITDVELYRLSAQFKVGDRVVYVGDRYPTYQNQILTLHEVSGTQATLILPDGRFTTWLDLKDLQLAGDS